MLKIRESGITTSRSTVVAFDEIFLPTGNDLSKLRRALQSSKSSKSVDACCVRFEKVLQLLGHSVESPCNKAMFLKPTSIIEKIYVLRSKP